MNEDFLIDQGVPTFTGRGRKIMFGFEKLICSATAVIDSGVFDVTEAEPDSLLAQGDALPAYINFCLSYAFTPARAFYGASQASIFIDVLFWRFFNKLPEDELFQRYLELRLLPGDPAQSKQESRIEFSRPFQFIVDVIGRPDLAPLILLPVIGMQVALDGKQVLEAPDPEQKAIELAETFSRRVFDRLEKYNPTDGLTKMAEKIEVLCDIHHSPMEMVQYKWGIFSNDENVSAFMRCLECSRHYSPLQGYVDITKQGMDTKNRRMNPCPREGSGTEWHGSMAIVGMKGDEFIWGCLRKSCKGKT